MKPPFRKKLQLFQHQKGVENNKIGNKEAFLIAILDEMYFSSEMANELPRDVALETASDAKDFGGENITVQAAVIVQNAENGADGEKSSTFLDEKCFLQDNTNYGKIE
ncbi:hypothetical protein AVEN_130977-1 [Araneus ventricosus]|uniref:Uncharacterized protein n=1 Tax=Araneus ventricosus TaxID=182803 RepID=A0A4Y2UXV9_ARAVE|nr:hypothetical protein AVEN_130977-1 [Araneus ventricosus]